MREGGVRRIAVGSGSPTVSPEKTFVGQLKISHVLCSWANEPNKRSLDPLTYVRVWLGRVGSTPVGSNWIRGCPSPTHNLCGLDRGLKSQEGLHYQSS